MKFKGIYDALFTEYPGHLGFAPAVLTIAITLSVCASLLYGGVVLGKSIFLTHAPPAEATHT